MIRAGVGLVPEDRRGQGIIPDFSVRENLLLAHLGARHGGLCGYHERDDEIRRVLGLLGLPAEWLLDASLLDFSGGMQQKLILARWLILMPRLLLLDEPTRGVDISTRSSIYAQLRMIAEQGVACVVVSSDFEEVIGLTDRVVVLSDGRDVTNIPSHLVDVEKLAVFAAPRSSAGQTHSLLESLVARYGGVAFWAAVDRDQLFCFDRVGSDRAADPGFDGGEFPMIAETRITTALAQRAPGFVAEVAGDLHTILVSSLSRKGHDFGFIGLCLGTPPHDADEVRRQIDSATALEAAAT